MATRLTLLLGNLLAHATGRRRLVGAGKAAATTALAAPTAFVSISLKTKCQIRLRASPEQNASLNTAAATNAPVRATTTTAIIAKSAGQIVWCELARCGKIFGNKMLLPNGAAAGVFGWSAVVVIGGTIITGGTVVLEIVSVFFFPMTLSGIKVMPLLLRLVLLAFLHAGAGSVKSRPGTGFPQRMGVVKTTPARWGAAIAIRATPDKSSANSTEFSSYARRAK